MCVCVCENWKGCIVKHNYASYDVLMTILDNYMFRPLLAIFRLSSRELKVLLYIIYIYIGLYIICITYITYSRTLSSLEDNFKMGSTGRRTTQYILYIIYNILYILYIVGP